MSYQPGIYCYSTKHHVRTFRVSHRQSSNAKDTSLGVGADLLQLVVKFLCDAGRCITFKEIDPWVGQRYQRSGDAVLVHVTNLVVDIEVFSPNGSTCPKLMRQHQSTVQYKAAEVLQTCTSGNLGIFTRQNDEAVLIADRNHTGDGCSAPQDFHVTRSIPVNIHGPTYC
jgi:hypothetical protein